MTTDLLDVARADATWFPKALIPHWRSPSAADLGALI